MKMNQTMRLQILAFLADDSKPTPTGHVCRFLRLSDTVGAKIYGNSEGEIRKAQGAQATQAKAFGLGLAPEPGEYFRIHMRLGSNSSVDIHGYFTEVVTQKASPYRDRDYYDAECKLSHKMAEAGFRTGDVREANVGWNRDGELVCLDWDPLSIGC